MHEDNYVPEESGFISNISESGICISTASTLVIGDILALYFRLPAIDYNFSIKVRVIWSKKEKAGCEYTHINNNEIELIRKYNNENSSELYSYYQKLMEHFKYKAADAEEQKEYFKLRYMIYVKEQGWEPENEIGIEIDKYDVHSSHFVVKDKGGVVVAGIRLIAAGRTELPIEKYFNIDVENKKLYKRHEIAEVSRFCIAKEYRRRIEDLQYNDYRVYLKKADENKKIIQRSPTLLFGLWKIMYQYSKIANIKYWYMELEPMLANSLINAGINLEKIGEPKDYHGKRSPYFINLGLSGRELECHNPVLFKWMSKAESA